MRRTILVLALAALMATTMALTVGPALAKDTNSAHKSYTDTFKDGFEYNAVPPLDSTSEGIAQFRATAEGDLPGAVDVTTHYTGIPGPKVTSTLTDGTWILCSKFTAPPRDATGNLIEPQCTSDSEISLKGTLSGGTAAWEKDGSYIQGSLGKVWIGKAKVKADLAVTGGTVKGKTVTAGSGKLEGTLDHTPLLSGGRPTVTGTMKLQF
jgi:hypothetical protein